MTEDLMRMARSIKACKAPVSSFRPNCLAAMISLAGVTFFIFSFQPQPAGAHLGAKAFQVPQLSPSVAMAPIVPSVPSSPEAVSNSASAIPTGLTGKEALKLKHVLLEKGRARLEKISDYTATFVKQERIDGSDIQEVQTIHLKLRHQPFSVYMKWLVGPVGQEVLYVDGLHENRMLVKKGGRMGKLLPVVKIDPTGSLAMAEARHPVTDAGLLTLTAKVLSYSTRDLTLEEGIECQMISGPIHNRPCHCFIVNYASVNIDPLYRKSITYVDEQLLLPIHIKNFGWPQDNAAAPDDSEDLLEYYAFTDVQFDRRLADADFDHQNKQYTFKR